MFKHSLVGRGFIIIILKRINIDQMGFRFTLSLNMGKSVSKELIVELSDHKRKKILVVKSKSTPSVSTLIHTWN